MKKVKFYENERLDIIDQKAVQDLTYDYVARALGAILGPVEGTSDKLTVDYSEWDPSQGHYKVYIRGSTYFIKTHKAGTINYDTDATGEISELKQDVPGANAAYATYFDDSVAATNITVDFTALVNSFGTANTEWSADKGASLTKTIWDNWRNHSVWVRKVRSDTETNTRRFWDNVAADEVAKNVKTRSEDILEWNVGLTDNAAFANQGWIRVFDIVGVSAGSKYTTDAEANYNDDGVLHSPNAIAGDAADKSFILADGSSDSFSIGNAITTDLISPDESSNAQSGDQSAPNLVPVGAPHLRQVYWWDYTRQNIGTPPNLVSLGETSKPLLPAKNFSPTGKDKYFNKNLLSDPPRVGYPEDGKVSWKIDKDSGDLLEAIKKSDDPKLVNDENYGVPGLLSRIVRSLSQIRSGVDYDPYVFRQIFEGGKVTGKNDADGEYTVNTDVGRPASMRPLYHLDQFYRNWAMSTPHVLLAGRIIATTGSGYMWYGPTYNPLGFEILGDSSVINSYMVYPPSYPQSNPGAQTWGGDKLHYDLRIRTPKDTYIFSVNATPTSSWQTNGADKMGKPWATQAQYSAVDTAAAGPEYVRTLSVHVGQAVKDGPGTWDQDIFVTGTREGTFNHWFYITVIGTNPNYTADYVYRGVQGPAFGGATNQFKTNSASNNVRGSAHAMEATGWANKLDWLNAAEAEKLGTTASVPGSGYGREVAALDWGNIGADPADATKDMGYGDYGAAPTNPKAGGDSNKNAGAAFYQPASAGWWQWRKPNG